MNTSITTAADNFHFLQKINDEDREQLGVDSTGRLVQSPAVGVCKDRVQEVVRKTWQELGQLPNIIRKLSLLPMEDDIQQREFFHTLFVEIHKSQDNSDDLFQRALTWSGSNMGSLTDGLSIAEAKKILDKQEPKHSMVKVASVKTIANKERPKVTIHVNTQSLEDAPLMSWEKLPIPTGWAKHNPDNLFTAQLRDESGSVVVGNAPMVGDLSLWSAEGEFIKVFDPLNHGPILSVKALERGFFSVDYYRNAFTDILSPKGDLINTFFLGLIHYHVHMLKEGYAIVLNTMPGYQITVYTDGILSLKHSTSADWISFMPLPTGGFALGERPKGKTYFQKITIWQLSPGASESEKQWSIINTLNSTLETQWNKMAALPNGHLVLGSTRDRRQFWDPVTNAVKDFGAFLPIKSDPPESGSFQVLPNGQIVEMNTWGDPKFLWDANGMLKARFFEGYRKKLTALHITKDQQLLVTDSDGTRGLYSRSRADIYFQPEVADPEEKG